MCDQKVELFHLPVLELLSDAFELVWFHLEVLEEPRLLDKLCQSVNVLRFPIAEFLL